MFNFQILLPRTEKTKFRDIFFYIIEIFDRNGRKWEVEIIEFTLLTAILLISNGNKKATSQPASPGRPKGGRDRILGLIALFKFCKAALLLAVGIGTLELVRTDLTAWPQHWVSALASNVGRRTVEQLLARVSQMDPGHLEALGVGAFLYTVLFTVEGIGLWRGKRWAEYLTAIATASFVPLEIYELTHRVSPRRLSALLLNLAIVAYLIYRLRRREAKT